MKELLRNSWILAVLVFVISVFVGFVITFIFGEVSMAASAVCGFIAAMGVGQIYTYAFREVMTKRLRFKTALDFFIIQAAMGGLVLIMLVNIPWWLFVIFMLVIIPYSLLIYWSLGFGGRMQLKGLERKNKI